MAWSLVSGATLKANVATPGSTAWNAGSLAAAVQANDVLFANVTVNHATTLLTADGISDSLGNTWTKALSVNGTALGVVLEQSLWYAVSSAGTPSSITVTLSGIPGSQGAGISVQAVRGLSTATGASGGIDISKLATVASTPVTDSGTTAGTTSAANEFKLGFYADWGSGQTVSAGTLDTTYTMDVNDSPNGNAETCLEHADSGASGSTARATVSGPTSGQVSTTGVLVYQLAGAAGFDPSTVPWLAPALPTPGLAVVGF